MITSIQCLNKYFQMFKLIQNIQIQPIGSSDTFLKCIVVVFDKEIAVDPIISENSKVNKLLLRQSK